MNSFLLNLIFVSQCCVMCNVEVYDLSQSVNFAVACWILLFIDVPQRLIHSAWCHSICPSFRCTSTCSKSHSSTGTGNISAFTTQTAAPVCRSVYTSDFTCTWKVNIKWMYAFTNDKIIINLRSLYKSLKCQTSETSVFAEISCHPPNYHYCLKLEVYKLSFLVPNCAHMYHYDYDN